MGLSENHPVAREPISRIAFIVQNPKVASITANCSLQDNHLIC